VRSFARLQDVPPGFNPNDVLSLELSMSAAATTTLRRCASRIG
jgi:hypothetical protein